MAREFKPGDVVRLKSGGPWMTVIGDSLPPTNETEVVCVWFNPHDLNESKVSEFVYAALVKFEGDINQLHNNWEACR